VLMVVSLGIGKMAVTPEFGRALNVLKCHIWWASAPLAVFQEGATGQTTNPGCVGLRARISPTLSAKLTVSRVLASMQTMEGRFLKSASIVVKRWANVVCVSMHT